MAKYLNLSISLETNSVISFAAKSLGIDIESGLEQFHAALGQQLAQARSTLARTRNRLLSPISRLPEDLLSEIFMKAIFTHTDPPKDDSDVDISPMEYSVITVHRTLHSLLGVCSLWKNFILVRGIFWSVVPLFYSPSISMRCTQALGLGIARAGTGNLHLAASYSTTGDTIDLDILADHASRFSTCNIFAHSTPAIRSVMKKFLAPDSTKALALSQLSVRVKCHPHRRRYPSDLDYVFPQDSSEQNLFEKLAANLSVLRIRNFDIHWSKIVFSQRLTELHLQGIWCYESTVIDLLGALSVTKLRSLKFISVRTVPDDTPIARDEQIKRTVSLPSLQSLFIEDLFCETLKVILSSITSRSHKLSLFLTPKCQFPGDYSEDAVYKLLRHIPVSICSIDGHEDGRWLSIPLLKKLLESMSTLETLKINAWKFDRHYCEALTLHPESQSTSQTSSFPSLKTLCFTRVIIDDEEAFKNMLASHSGSLQRMVLGGFVCHGFDPEAGDILDLHTLEAGGPFVNWISSHVQNLELIGPTCSSPEFQEHSWHLW
ncbi:unnamed protein product [Rhizoctonia solani]|uniref:F-box domain-containing protein n=1 Tax=Rhizoctonia solani TaxID=456999 RepID=A0A8H3BUL9_9AGAM|nr:unnamed protein product [Rhizoctonia solani]